jgi:membrane protease YdiL (CAAX protease family)
MAVSAWVVAPQLADSLGELGLVKALVLTLTAGLIWQFLLVTGLVYREQQTLQWSAVRDALWLRSPRSAKTGRVGGRLWWVLVPMTVLFALQEAIPIPSPADRDFGSILDSPSGEVWLRGSWGWFTVLLVLVLFNTVLGEELLFRGYLLPRLEGRFGKRAWLVNGVAFATYHLHTPWVIPTALLDSLALSYPSQRYRSAWLGIIVHSVQSVIIMIGVLVLVLSPA